jgi:hypothetical protein
MVSVICARALAPATIADTKKALLSKENNACKPGKQSAR